MDNKRQYARISGTERHWAGDAHRDLESNLVAAHRDHAAGNKHLERMHNREVEWCQDFEQKRRRIANHPERYF
jgi:hypothetical protein